MREVDQEIVGVSRLDAEWGEGSLGEIPRIHGDDGSTFADDRGGEDMSIVGVGKVETLIIPSWPLTNGSSICCSMRSQAFECVRFPMGLVAKKGPHPFPLNLDRPLWLVAEFQTKFHQQIAEGGGIQDNRVKKCLAEGRFHDQYPMFCS